MPNKNRLVNVWATTNLFLIRTNQYGPVVWHLPLYRYDFSAFKRVLNQFADCANVECVAHHSRYV